MTRFVTLISSKAAALLLIGTTFASASVVRVCRDAFSGVSDELILGLKVNEFTTGRDLDNYGLNLDVPGEGGSLRQAFERLPPKAVYLDVGAGQGRALAQALSEYPAIGEGIGLAYKRAEGLSELEFTDGQERLTFLEGDLLEAMVAQGRLDSWVGRVNLITDVFGPLSYTENFPRVLQIYLDLLTVGGEIRFNMSENDEGFLVNTLSLRADDRGHETFEPWLKTIKGLEITRDDREGARYRIVKRAPKVKVPVNLRLRSYRFAYPPRRHFEVGDENKPGQTNCV